MYEATGRKHQKLKKLHSLISNIFECCFITQKAFLQVAIFLVSLLLSQTISNTISLIQGLVVFLIISFIYLFIFPLEHEEFTMKILATKLI